MSSISGISGSGYSNYGSFASGKSINSAADGASELAIAEKEQSQVNGYNAGTENMQQSQDMLNVADSALSTVTDNLQRIRELSLQASNSAVMSDEDLQSIQDEIEQLKQGIADVADQTTYNGKQILNNDEAYAFVTDGNGSTSEVQMSSATLEALGIADYDVTGDFDISVIDEALEKVSSSRSSIGASSNALSYAIDSNNSAAYYHTQAVSNQEDLDYEEEITEQKKQEALQAYSNMVQKRKLEEEENSIYRLFQ